MIEEVKYVAIAQKWEYNIFEEKFSEADYGKETFNEDLFGISFSPEECEPVCLTFLSNGAMVSIISWHIRFNLKDDSELNEYVSVKTQFAGPSTHKHIVLFLEYLSKNILKNLNLRMKRNIGKQKMRGFLRKNLNFLQE